MSTIWGLLIFTKDTVLFMVMMSCWDFMSVPGQRAFVQTLTEDLKENTK